MNKPKISVIVPIFNAEQYLYKCLDSIINQSYLNLEIILVNDGSTDDSTRIIKEYAANDKRIIAINKENNGIGSAYRIAFQLMTGDFVTFVDSDDFIALNTYEELINIAIKEDPDMIHFGIKVINQNDEEIKLIKNPIKDEIIIGKSLILEKHFNTLKHPSLARFFKKNLFNNIIIFEQNIGIDEMLTPQLLINCERVVYTTNVYYFALARQNSVCRANFTERKIKETIKVYRFICKFMENHIPIYTHLLQLKYLGVLNSIYNFIINDNFKLHENVIEDLHTDFKSHFIILKKRRLFKSEHSRLFIKFCFIANYPSIFIRLNKTIKWIMSIKLSFKR